MKKDEDYIGIDDKYIPNQEEIKSGDNKNNRNIIDKASNLGSTVLDEVTNNGDEKTIRKGVKLFKNIFIGHWLFVVIVGIVIFIGCIGMAIYIFNFASNMNDSSNDIESTYSVNSFNNGIELSLGVKSTFFTESLLDKIVSSNVTNEKQIMVVFNGVEYSSNTEISSLIVNELTDSSSTYLNSALYDDDGYIYQINIDIVS